MKRASCGMASTSAPVRASANAETISRSRSASALWSCLRSQLKMSMLGVTTVFLLVHLPGRLRDEAVVLLIDGFPAPRTPLAWAPPGPSSETPMAGVSFDLISLPAVSAGRDL